MRSPEDLSATDSHLVLMEYCEEHPLLVMATGMSTKIKNYYHRPEVCMSNYCVCLLISLSLSLSLSLSFITNQRQVKGGAPNFSYGEITYIQNTPYFLGSLQPGQSLQVRIATMYVYDS